MNVSLLTDFDNFGIRMALHRQDHGLIAIYRNSRILPRGVTTVFKVKFEEVNKYTFIQEVVQILNFFHMTTKNQLFTSGP